LQPKGEALAFGVFGGIALLGFLLSFGIRGGNLEGGEWDEEQDGGSEGSSSDEADEDEVDREERSERRSLLEGRK